MANNIRHTSSDKYQKALSLQDRNNIHNMIAENRNQDGSLKISLKSIAEKLEKDPTTISKEVKNHRTQLDTSIPKPTKLALLCKSCAKKGTCEFKAGNGNMPGVCSEYEKYYCPHTKKFPWVCNNCGKRGMCGAPKSYYNPENAEQTYKEVLSSSRQGLYTTQEELASLNKIVSDGISKKQSIEHIKETHKLEYSTKTIYNYLHNGYFDASPIQCHRIPRLRPKGKNIAHNSVKLRVAKEGHMYSDFTKLRDDAVNTGKPFDYCQLDTVEGKKGDTNFILSLKLVNIQFQFYFLIKHKTAKSVVDKLNEIQSKIGLEMYKKLFGIILTDNGTEFTDLEGIMQDPNTGEIRSDLYFCQALASWQKGSCERSHEYFRYIVPKGVSLDQYTQEDINLITSHTNAAKRRKIDFSSPVELFIANYGQEVLTKLGIQKIEPNDVILSSDLLKKSK